MNNFSERIHQPDGRPNVSVFVPGDDPKIVMLSTRQPGMGCDLHMTIAQAIELSDVLVSAASWANVKSEGINGRHALADAVDAVNSMTVEELALLPSSANDAETN